MYAFWATSCMRMVTCPATVVACRFWFLTVKVRSSATAPAVESTVGCANDRAEIDSLPAVASAAWAADAAPTTAPAVTASVNAPRTTPRAKLEIINVFYHRCRPPCAPLDETGKRPRNLRNGHPGGSSAWGPATTI